MPPSLCNGHIVIRDIRDGDYKPMTLPKLINLLTFYPQTIHLYKTRKHLLATDNYKKQHTFYCVTEDSLRQTMRNF